MFLAAASSILAEEESRCTNSSPVCLESIWKQNECAYNGHIRVGFLAEQMRITGTEVSVTESASNSFSIDGNTVTGLPSRINPIKFDLDFGLTVGLGYLFDHENYSITADFEWLSSKGVSNVTGTTYIFDSVSPFYSGTLNATFSAANASLRVDYYLLDIAISKGYYVSNRFTYEPFTGLKAAWINYNDKESFTISGPSGIPSNTAWQRSNKVDFWGVGPMVGIGGNYYLLKDFSVYSELNGSVLLGETTLTNVIYFYPQGTEDALQAKDNLVVASPTLRMTLGLQYDCSGAFDHDEFMIRVGFDGRYYFNQYPVVHYMGTDVSNDAGRLTPRPKLINNSYSMVGLVVDATWRF